MRQIDLKKINFRPKMLPLILALFTVLLVATGFMYANKKVQIAVDGTTKTIRTLHSKPEEVLVQAGINLGTKDEYRLSTETLTDGSVISVYRAVPITVTYQGKTEEIVTAKPTVEEVAESLGWKKENTKLVPEGQTKVAAEMEIEGITLTEETVERDEDVPFTVVRQPDSSLEKGVERTVEEGENGIKTITMHICYEDGNEVSSEKISEKIKEEPKPQIIRVGVREIVETSRGSMRYSRVATMQASAYLPTDGSGAGITATGVKARRGIVAVDPRVIPLGTRLYVEGYGLATAADVGGAIVGNRIDLCMEDDSEAWGFGRRSVKVYVLD
jgi:uncharacterized protein YabE (DUF348 family)